MLFKVGIDLIIEIHEARHLQEYFDKTNTLHINQSGFSKGHSCQIALINIIDTWLRDIDSGKYVRVVSLIYEKHSIW